MPKKIGRRWTLLEPWETDGKGWCIAEKGVILAAMTGDERPAADGQTDAAMMAASPVLIDMLAEAVERIAPGVSETRVRAMRSLLAHLLPAEPPREGGDHAG